jgi:tetratricopeptide (TPR) repeat protein
MKNKYFHLFILFISIAGITFEASSIVKSYFAKAVNIQYLARNISTILFFLGVIFFYIFYKNRKLLYLGYFFLFINICVQIALIILLKSFHIILVPYIIGSIYVFYQINKYLYKINDKIFLLTISKIRYIDKQHRYNLAWLYYNEKNYEKSIKILKNCVTLDEFYLLANNYEQINEYEKAIELYTKILLNDVNERPEIFYNRGAIYKKLGMYDEAIKDFISCINCDKPDPKAYIALGVIKDESGKNMED